MRLTQRDNQKYHVLVVTNEKNSCLNCVNWCFVNCSQWSFKYVLHIRDCTL